MKKILFVFAMIFATSTVFAQTQPVESNAILDMKTVGPVFTPSTPAVVVNNTINNTGCCTPQKPVVENKRRNYRPRPIMYFITNNNHYYSTLDCPSSGTIGNGGSDTLAKIPTPDNTGKNTPPTPSENYSPFAPWFWNILGFLLLLAILVALIILIKNLAQSKTATAAVTEKKDVTSVTSVTESKTTERNAKELVEKMQTTGGNLNWDANGTVSITIPQQKSAEHYKLLEKVLMDAKTSGVTVTVNGDGGYTVDQPKKDPQ